MGTNVGGPICGRRLIAIGRPGQDTGKPIMEITASKCGEFGLPAPDYDATRARSVPVELPVAMPVQLGEPFMQDAVTNCRNCSHYVTSTGMATSTGWNAGYCAARGVLLFEDRLTEYAKDCSTRTLGNSQMSWNDLGTVFYPEYQDGFGRVNLATLLKDRSSDPQEFATEAPVAPAQVAQGIRAYRLIQDPEGYGPDIKLPIFATSYFSAEEAVKVPRIGDQESPEDYLDHGGFVYKVAALWMELDETPAVWGPSGVGKTELFRHLAFLMGLPFERISITPSSEIDDLIGKPGYTPERGTFFTYGRLPKAWMKPCVVALDEPNSGPDDVWMCIRPLTDNSKQLVVDQNNGERCERHAFCFPGMSMNPAWDARNTGVRSLADADGNRLMHIFMDLPPETVERDIIKRALERDLTPEDEIKRVLDIVMGCARDIRALSGDGIIPVSWGIRSQIKVARAMKFFAPVTAYRIGVADSLESNAQQAILDVVKSKVE